jgi:hypothetical protein
VPDIETTDLWQKAVLWPRTGVDRHNEPLRGEGVELNVRWETRREEVVDAQGNRAVLDAVVVLDRQVEPGDFMWLGQLSYWLGTGSSGDDDEIMEVIVFKATPDIRDEEVRRTAGLKKFRSSLPASSS